MKVLHFITSLKIGGAESALVNFLTYTQRKQPGNYQHIVIYLYHGPNVEKIQNLGIWTYQLTGLLHQYDPIALAKLIFFIKKCRPNIIHTALWSANIMGRLAGWCLGIPVVSDLHGSALDEGSFRNRLDALTAPLTRKIVAVSNSVQEAYRQAVISKVIGKNQRKLVTQKLCVINNGIDIDQIRATENNNPLKRSDFNWDKSNFVIGAVGRLEPIKSYDVLIRAFALLLKEKSLKKSPKLCLIGDGSEMQKLKDLALQLNITNSIYFAGSRSDAIKFYRLFDCFALSSQSEGLSIALLEALCFGLPVITTHHSLQHDVITHNVNGLLIPIGNEQALADALKSMILNLGNQKTFHDANIQLIQQFDLSKTAQTYTKVYQNIG